MIPRGWGTELPTAAALLAAIDRHLAVRFVEWNEVDDYVGGLEAILDGVRLLARRKPLAAHRLALHFLRRVPTVFDSVHDETELADFCRELSEAALALGVKARVPVPRTAEVLLRLYVEDDYGRFGAAPDVLAAARLSSGDRARCAEIADRLADEPGSERTRRELHLLAERMRRPSKV